MNEGDKMAIRLSAFILGSTLALIGIFSVSNRTREGKVLDCAFNGVACKRWAIQNAGKLGLTRAESYCLNQCNE